MTTTANKSAAIEEVIAMAMDLDAEWLDEVDIILLEDAAGELIRRVASCDEPGSEYRMAHYAIQLLMDAQERWLARAELEDERFTTTQEEY